MILNKQQVIREFKRAIKTIRRLINTLGLRAKKQRNLLSRLKNVAKNNENCFPAASGLWKFKDQEQEFVFCKFTGKSCFLIEIFAVNSFFMVYQFLFHCWLLYFRLSYDFYYSFWFFCCTNLKFKRRFQNYFYSRISTTLFLILFKSKIVLS